MVDSDDAQLWDGRLVAAARALAGLTVVELAEDAGVGVSTIQRIEDRREVRVAPGYRHGAVSAETWERIIASLGRHGVELVPARGSLGPGVRFNSRQ